MLFNVLMHVLGSRKMLTLNMLHIFICVGKNTDMALIDIKRPQSSQNFVSKPTLATYFLYFDFCWKLFSASPESLHISKSMVKGEEVRVGGSWVLSDQGQLQRPGHIPGVTIPEIWLLLGGRCGHQQ